MRYFPYIGEQKTFHGVTWTIKEVNYRLRSHPQAEILVFAEINGYPNRAKFNLYESQWLDDEYLEDISKQMSDRIN